MKGTSHNFLVSKMKNIKYELFTTIEIELNQSDDESDLDTNALNKEVQTQIEIDKNNEEEEDNNECIIRTDEKYLDFIKKNENNILLETKLRIKVKSLT